MKSFPGFRSLIAALVLALTSGTPAFAAVSDLLFTVEVDNQTNTPTFTVTNNSPTLEINRFELTIGKTAYEFDARDFTLEAPADGSAIMALPGPGLQNDNLVIDLTKFGPGKTFKVRIDIDTDGQNDGVGNPSVFFNTSTTDNIQNSVATVRSGPASASITLEDKNARPATFRGPNRVLRVKSKTETVTGNDGELVRGISVLRNGKPVDLAELNKNNADFDLTVAHGDRIQIKAPQEVFKDINSNYISDSSGGVQANDQAEERFVAIGMSVNDIAQTADPTNYNFEITQDTEVAVKWDHFYALTIAHDFSKTVSQEIIAGTPWAGPLASNAAGNPNPPVSKQWVRRGSEPVVQIDGQSLDTFSHPGLDLRYVVKGFLAYGPPNKDVGVSANAERIKSGVDIRNPKKGTVLTYANDPARPGWTLVTTAGEANSTRPHGLALGTTPEITISGSSHAAFNGKFTVVVVDQDKFSIPVPFPSSQVTAKGLWQDTTYVRFFPFESVEPRQQVKPNFNMYGPGGITYVWQIQYGVRVNADDPNRVQMAKVYEVVNGVDFDRTVPDGVSWFDPGASIKVVSGIQEAGVNGQTLTGWVNGDGYYFATLGQIDPTTGQPTTGAPATANGSPVAQWLPTGPFNTRGYSIPNLQRPVRTVWRYGAGAILIQATVGKHLFEDYPQYASMFVRPPEPITNAIPDTVMNGENGAAPSPDMMVEWDPIAGRLFPTLPGRFTVPWKPGTESTVAVEVRVIAQLPTDTARSIRGHYPHVNGAPAVALDPDPNDDFAFKSIKYSNAGGTVDGDKRFSTTRPGYSILLFSQIQRVGRGQPREFLQVRVVDTRSAGALLPGSPTTATVGSKILDSSADAAGLGTGFLYDPTGRARYNPFIYDSTKLAGLAARDIYDMALLRADNSSLVVVNKNALPGPIIPVNEQPGAGNSDLPIVFWYDDPRRNDTLMWPNAVRNYKPAWPATSSVPQIVIASQFGSDGKSSTGQEQMVAPAIGDAPVANSYDPSRIQAVQIYSQPNPNAPGYNPNEEHALIAPSLRYAAVSPRPPAIYALRDGDLNNSNRATPNSYTSHPFVLSQFLDVAAGEVKMKVYSIKRQSGSSDTPKYAFASDYSPSVTNLKSQPYVKMKAGEPVIPFYPLGVAIGASPAPETYGNNFFPQETYWEDWRGSYWSISGGDNAWFNVSFYYPLAPDFWWPSDVKPPIIKIEKNGATYTPKYDKARPGLPGVGDAVAFLPTNVRDVSTTLKDQLPTAVIYKSEWPDNPAVLKAGETLTFSGGEYRADKPTQTIVRNGVAETVQTPGLPQLTAFASAEVVFDSLNAEAVPAQLTTHWTARVVQALDRRLAPLATTAFPSELQPASGRTTVKQGKYVFNELPASLQRRLRYDPLAVVNVTTNGVTSQVNGGLQFIGLLNDKEIGDSTLTASPPAVYVLEPNILTDTEKQAILDLVPLGSSARPAWATAVENLYNITRNPESVPGTAGDYLAGLMRMPLYAANGSIVKDALGNVQYATPTTATRMRAFGPGLALVPNAGFLDPQGKLSTGANFPDESWVTVVENNDASLGGSPITPHIIKVDRRQRYRGSIKTMLSDNVFDENIELRSTGDFGANAKDLVFEWWYRPDDGSLNVPPPDLIPAGQTNPWKLFPDPSGKAGAGRYQMTLKGNPNAPEALLADTLWFVRYRHKNDQPTGTNWKLPIPGVNFTWAGAGNSQPFVDADLDGFKDFRAQLAQGWIKRVLDAVNPYEARIRDFEGDSPSTLASMISQFGARYEGPVALNPSKNVIENVGLIELYQTILNRGRSLSIDLSRPVSTPAIANALQLASTRISDFYTLLGNEAYGDAIDPTVGTNSGSVATSVHAFQNQTSSQMEEELDLLRGVDDFFARPVYNRLFWNFTKGEGEAAYATNYNITDINADGFIDEKDAMIQFPQGHGDAWGHYLTAMRNQYELLRHPYFNWVSRAESYNLQDIVISVDFLDERKFAATAAAKAKTAAEIVSLTYRDHYVADPDAQWQGYTDSNPDRAWGVDEWSRRSGQGCYFDWVTANALLPSQHPNTKLEGIRKVDRTTNSDIAVVSANLNTIQRTIDEADRGYNPLGLARGAQVFDLERAFIDNSSGGDRRSHFDQIHERAAVMMENVTGIWDQANESANMLREVGNSETEFRYSTFQEDLSYRNQLIQIFGKPYAGTVGPGKLYPAGYEGPDLGLYMYVPVREINKDTVPGPSASYASFDSSGKLTSGSLYDAYTSMNSTANLQGVDENIRSIFSATFGSATNSLTYGQSTAGLFDVSYTDLTNPKVPLDQLISKMPVTAAGYTFQAPAEWGARPATGELQDVINQMIQQEAEVAKAIGAWDSLSGEVVRILRLIDAKLVTSAKNQGRDEAFGRAKYAINGVLAAMDTTIEIVNSAKETSFQLKESISKSIPKNLPTAGLAFSPGDALSAAVGANEFAYTVVSAGFNGVDDTAKIVKTAAQIALDVAETELNLAKAEESRKLEIREWLKEVEDKVGDEPVLRIAVFKEIQALQALSDRYRTLLDEGGRLIDERAAFNKRVAAQTQLNRYQDMTFRVSRNHALQTYRSSFDLAARYAYLAATAFDYETNFNVNDPASPADAFEKIIGARSIDALSKTLNQLKMNHDVLRAQLGLNN